MQIIGKELKCPDCEGTKFLQSRRGGAAVNVKCCNCGCEINIAKLPDGRYVLIDRLSPERRELIGN